MRRVITLGILIIVCFVLQSALFPYIEVAGATPNLLLILTVSFGLMRGRKEGMLVGFFCGFLYDLYFGFAIGPFMIIYMLIGTATVSFTDFTLWRTYSFRSSS